MFFPLLLPLPGSQNYNDHILPIPHLPPIPLFLLFPYFFQYLVNVCYYTFFSRIISHTWPYLYFVLQFWKHTRTRSESPSLHKTEPEYFFSAMMQSDFFFLLDEKQHNNKYFARLCADYSCNDAYLDKFKSFEEENEWEFSFLLYWVKWYKL